MRPFMPHGRHTDGRTQGLRQPRGITLLHKRSAEGGDTASIPCAHEDESYATVPFERPCGTRWETTILRFLNAEVVIWKNHNLERV